MSKKRKPFRWESEEPPKAIVTGHTEDYDPNNPQPSDEEIDNWINQMKKSGKLKDKKE